MTYCIDTSSLIAAWQERYPIENFPSFWAKLDALITEGRLLAPIDVLHEAKKRSDELHTWLKARKSMFRELNDDIQIEAARVLAMFPRLVGERKLRTSADPFVIAMARVEGLQLVTDEKPSGSLARPNIPDVCAELNMTTIGLLQVIQSERWVVG
jgi:predicted nucleic acid-binding protein